MATFVRHLVLILGDQLDEASAAFDGFDARQDAVWLAEVGGEARYVWSHQARIALFFSAMRHFRDQLLERGWRVFYRQIDDPSNSGTLAAELVRSLRELQPQRVIVVEPGEWRVAQDLRAATQTHGTPLEIRADRHFFCSTEEFRKYAGDRRQLRLEFFYRNLRRRTGVLMQDDHPLGGQWNFDRDNRKSFPKSGPGFVPEPRCFPPDDITQEVLRLVARQFANHPGRLDRFDWPVTAVQAKQALADFIDHRLSLFGPYQDAMWTGQPWLYHSRLSAALNLKLLNPREVVSAALAAYPDRASLTSVEGFVRQILGWREYVRGIYWLDMPQYLERNALGASLPLPPFYWTAQTDMNCLQQVISQTLELGFAHHIQRLMVTGLFALLLGVHPKKVHEWYLAVYVDAVEWVELPNTLGMSQYADGGMMASKPYIATGQYIRRMSNYCAGCRYRPEKRIGPDACPFTTLYWDFLDRHQKLLRSNQRMTMQLRNLDRVPRRELPLIRRQADAVRSRCLA